MFPKSFHPFGLTKLKPKSALTSHWEKCRFTKGQVGEMTMHLANYGCSGKRQDTTKQWVLFLTFSLPVSLLISTVVHH
jgi:hypothetical protein